MIRGEIKYKKQIEVLERKCDSNIRCLKESFREDIVSKPEKKEKASSTGIWEDLPG